MSTSKMINQAIMDALSEPKLNLELVYTEAFKAWGGSEVFGMITSRPYSGAPLMGYVANVKCGDEAEGRVILCAFLTCYYDTSRNEQVSEFLGAKDIGKLSIVSFSEEFATLHHQAKADFTRSGFKG